MSFADMFLSIVLIVTGRLGPGHGFNFISQEIIRRQSFPHTFTQYQAQVAASFIPALIINLFSICWISGNRFYRTTQPIAGMFEFGNATETILLLCRLCGRFSSSSDNQDNRQEALEGSLVYLLDCHLHIRTAPSRKHFRLHACNIQQRRQLYVISRLKPRRPDTPLPM
jgi:hypothetical protein